MVIFPLAPDQTIAQMWSNGARGGNYNNITTIKKNTKNLNNHVKNYKDMQQIKNKLHTAIHVGSHWKIQDRRQIKNTDNTQSKHNTETENKAEQN